MRENEREREREDAACSFKHTEETKKEDDKKKTKKN